MINYGIIKKNQISLRRLISYHQCTAPWYIHDITLYTDLKQL